MIFIQLSMATATETPAGRVIPYVPRRLSVPQTMKPEAMVASATMTSESMRTPGSLVFWCKSLERAEADPAYFLGTDLNVSEDVAGNDDLTALFIGQAQVRAVGNGLAHDLGNSLGVESGLKRDLTANILNADLYFHSGASQPIKKLLSPLFVV
jgi:hypothetical protein